ncbi:MAG: hypothetical protein COT00_02105 [Candidatus Omnitrophica bacterium CG07_land_8_20_14_0_80_50_8]|nr:MAG: hypothetical protein COT00_02105 [Candidatus Omnitrophica bacterium CG07_land_8_20_14_0_80_50_8]
MKDWIERVGMVAGVALPFFNIPLIIKLIKRKSSKDLSLSWALGVWICIVLMTPQALRSQDITFRLFGIVNIIFFSAVAFFVLKYRR